MIARNHLSIRSMMNFFAYLGKFSKGEYDVDHLDDVVTRVLDSTQTTEPERNAALNIQEQVLLTWNEAYLRDLALGIVKWRFKNLQTLEQDLRVTLLGMDRESRLPYEEIRDKTQTELRVLSKVLYSRV